MGQGKSFYQAAAFWKILKYEYVEILFETGCDTELFDGLDIFRETLLCKEYMGKFPVISIILKGINGADYATARSLLCSVIGYEAVKNW